jgi:hypothetical protein
MRLPHGDQAIVEMVKLQEYCLSLTHPEDVIKHEYLLLS